jgi:cell division transport system permease protein
MIQAFFRILAYGIQGFRRNIWLSLIAIVTMTMTLLTLTAFALGDMIITRQYDQFSQQNVDYIIFIRDTASDIDLAQFRNQIEQRNEVVRTEFLNKDQARQRFEELFGDNPELKGVITDENNPLPREITVKFSSPEAISGFHQFVEDDRFTEIVENTSYSRNRSAIDNFLRVTNFVKILGISFTGFFIFVAILVMLNTIRLTIHSRRTEVEIMRFVGATQGYIRGPFIVEGVIFGLISAVIAALLAWLLLTQLATLISQTLVAGRENDFTNLFAGTLLSNGESAVAPLLARLFILQLFAGLALGIGCSIIAIRRYLKES